MMQPITINGPVAKPNSSAPNMHAMAMSRPSSTGRRLQTDAAAQVVHHQRLVRLSAMPSSHGSPAYLIDVSGLAPCRFRPGDRDVVGVTFRDAGRDCCRRNFADQLHAHASRRIRVLQVEDELRQIFNRVNVVMRRRADESTPGVLFRVAAMILSTLWRGVRPLRRASPPARL